MLLDTLSVTIRGAWGLRKLRTTYSGSCIRVRRSSDNAEQDVGFSAGALDTASLLTFVGSGSGYISKWYDQSTAGADLIQVTATRQVRIVNAGTLDALSNGTAKPSLVFSNGAGTTFLGNSSFVLGGGTFSTHSIVQRATSTDSSARILSFVGAGDGNDYSTTASVIPAYCAGGATTYGYNTANKSSVSLAANTPSQLVSVWDGTNHTMVLDGSSGSAAGYSPSITSSAGTLQLGTFAGNVNTGDQFNGLMAEHIIASGALSGTDRAAIRSSQKSYYGTA